MSEVRRGRPDDLGRLLAMERMIVEAPHWGEEEYRRALLAGDRGDGVRRAVFVAESAEGNGLVGFAVVGLLGMEGQAAELESLVVAPEARRQGVGTVLCREILLWSAGSGAAGLELEVRSGSKGALALYRRMGMREVGRRCGYYRDPVDDAVLMRVDLASEQRHTADGEGRRDEGVSDGRRRRTL